MENSTNKGVSILYAIIVTIVILQILTDKTNETFLLLGATRLSLLFVLFNYLLKGYAWSKWILSVYCLLIGLGGIVGGWFLIANKDILENNLTMGIIALITGTLYVLSSILIHILKDIKTHLAHQKENRNRITIRNHFANIFFSIGIAVIIYIEIWMLTIAVANTIANPKLIFGFILGLIYKLPLYAIPGLIIIGIGWLINKENGGQSQYSSK